MADQTPVDVDAIRARLDATSPGMTVDVHAEGSTLRATANTKNPPGFVGAVTGLVGALGGETGPLRLTFADDEDGQDATFALHAAADIRGLLDEVERLNAELDEWRHVGAQANQGLKDAAAELEARNDEITRMGKEIVKANEAFTAINRIIEPRDPNWKPLSDRYPQYFKHVSDEERARRNGWDQGVSLMSQRIQAAMGNRPAAPEMPRPPTEEAQERPETPGAGSGRGTGVAEASGTAQASEWPDVDGWTLTARPGGILLSHDTDADRPLLLSDERLPLGAVLAFIETQPEDVEEAEPDLSLIPAELIKSDPGIRGGEPCITGTRVPAHEVAGYLADGATWDEVREMLPSLPSLPAPSTERTTT